MERISAAGKGNADVAKANREVVEAFEQKLQDFAQYQKLSCKTMEQVRRLLADISATGSGNNVQLSGGQMAQKETLERLQETIQEQGDPSSRNFWKKFPEISVNFPRESRRQIRLFR